MSPTQTMRRQRTTMRTLRDKACSKKLRTYAEMCEEGKKNYPYPLSALFLGLSLSHHLKNQDKIFAPEFLNLPSSTFLIEKT